ncbi:unnamed protein product [Brassica oleracea var. botrytis]
MPLSMNYATTAWSLKLRLFFPLPIQDVGKHLSRVTSWIQALLLLGISSILKDILLGSAVSAYASVTPALSRPADQIFEIVNLANEVLPPLPQGVISLPTAGTNTLVKGSGQKNPSPSTSGKREDSLKVSPRQKLLSDQPELLQQFGLDLLPVLVQIHGSSVNGSNTMDT